MAKRPSPATSATASAARAALAALAAGPTAPAAAPAVLAAPVAAAPVAAVLVPLDQIEPWAQNPRRTFAPEAEAELADSIAARGVLQNLVVRRIGDRLQIGAGERRWRALRRLAAEGRWDPTAATVPVNIVDCPDDGAFLAVALVENLQRQDVPPLEEAEGFARLIALDPERWQPKTIAAQVGCSRRHIEQRLALLRLPDATQADLRAGKITVTQARAAGQTPAKPRPAPPPPVAIVPALADDEREAVRAAFQAAPSSALIAPPPIDPPPLRNPTKIALAETRTALTEARLALAEAGRLAAQTLALLDRQGHGAEAAALRRAVLVWRTTHGATLDAATDPGDRP